MGSIKTEFNGWVVLDQDSDPIFCTASDRDEASVYIFMNHAVHFFDTWDEAVNKGYRCVQFKMEINPSAKQ